MKGKLCGASPRKRSHFLYGRLLSIRTDGMIIVSVNSARAQDRYIIDRLKFMTGTLISFRKDKKPPLESAK